MTKGLFSSNTDLWATPQAFFDELNERFHFTLDPCANADNHKCEHYYTIEQDGLAQDWGGAKSVLQPTLRICNQALGKEVLRGKPKAEHPCSDAHSGKNGHIVFPRLHLPQGRTGVCSWQIAFQRSTARRTFPINGSDIQWQHINVAQ